jgi:hypothetical protein
LSKVKHSTAEFDEAKVRAIPCGTFAGHCQISWFPPKMTRTIEKGTVGKRVPLEIWTRKFMMVSHFWITAFALLLGSCAQMELSHNTDLAIDTYAPPATALGIAESRAKEYWTKHQEQIGPDTRYLAVQSDLIFSDEIPDLYAKLINSPGVNSSDLEDFGNNNALNIYCVNIFDTQTEKLVSPEGYAVVDHALAPTPRNILGPARR